MRTRVFPTVLLCSFLYAVGCSGTMGDKSPLVMVDQVPDTFQRQKFTELVERYTSLMLTHRPISDDECVTMVRMFNTIEMLPSDSMPEALQRFRGIFWQEYLTQCVDQLGAKLTKGMGYYSKSHDLYIGGPDHRPSRFILIN